MIVGTNVSSSHLHVNQTKERNIILKLFIFSHFSLASTKQGISFKNNNK